MSLKCLLVSLLNFFAVIVAFLAVKQYYKAQDYRATSTLAVNRCLPL